jgi:hypothetical protein
MSQTKRNVPKRQAIQSNAKRKQNPRARSKIPLFLMLGGAAILIAALFFVFRKPAPPYTPEVSGGPSLKADKEKVDLGDIRLGRTVQVSFTIKNVGDQPLQFSDAPYIEVKEGC